MNVLNFRELGGYKNKVGKSIKWHLLYRGGPFLNANLSEDDKSEIEKIGFKHIVDFRAKDEIERSGEIFIPKGCIYENLEAIDPDKDRIAKGDLDMQKRQEEEGIVIWLEKVYTFLPFDNNAYKKVFKYLLNNEAPLYFHCSAGKDRTGVFAALLLLALDVDRDIIYENYMLSYENMVKELEKENKPLFLPSLVLKEWLESAFEAIDKKYPNLLDYFKVELDLDLDDLNRLRSLYLED